MNQAAYPRSDGLFVGSSTRKGLRCEARCTSDGKVGQRCMCIAPYSRQGRPVCHCHRAAIQIVWHDDPRPRVSQELLEETVPTRDVCRMLGVSREALLTAERLGHLRVIHRPARNQAKRYVLRDVMELRKRCRVEGTAWLTTVPEDHPNRCQAILRARPGSTDTRRCGRLALPDQAHCHTCHNRKERP